MKSIGLILFIGAIFSMNPTSVSLIDAVKNGHIKMESEFLNLGEKGVVLNLTNMTSNHIELKIDPGTLFKPENNRDQTLMNLEEQLVKIAPRQKKTVNVDGYCIMLDKRVPNVENNFALSKTNDKNLKALIEFLQNKNVTKNNYQNAIWVVSNSEDIATIIPFNKDDGELREYLAKLTNSENPWYNKNGNIVANPGQTIERANTSIDGYLKIKPKETIHIYMTVENDKNEVKGKIDARELKKGYENELSFKLTVSNWKKGDYKIHVRNKANDESLKVYDFKV